MKKPLIFICVLLVLLTLCSCGKKQIIEVEVNTDPSEVKTDETDKTAETTQDGKDANITGIWQDSVSKKTILNAVKSDDMASPHVPLALAHGHARRTAPMAMRARNPPATEKRLLKTPTPWTPPSP